MAVLDVTGNSTASLSEGAAPLVVQASRGSGQVVLCAFDPAAPPLTTWSGTAALLSRIFAPAYQDTYYAEQFWSAAGTTSPVVTPRNIAAVPAPNFGASGTGTGGLLSPTAASDALLGYLEQMPVASPTPAWVFGLLLLGYVAVAGPLCFWALSRARRRELAWAVVPGLAVVGAAVLYVSGAGLGGGAMTDEVRVAQLAPGGHLAQVISLGAVYLPRGGAQKLQLTGPFAVAPALVGDLGAGAGAQLTVGPGGSSAPVGLTVRGPENSLGGWAASGATRLSGTVIASVHESGSKLSGTVTDDLGVKLEDVQVVMASGQATQDLGTIAPGASAPVDFVSSSNSVQPGGPGFAYPLVAGAVGVSGSAEARQVAADQGLYALGALYSGRNGGAPVLVAFASEPLFAPDLATALARPTPKDVVLVSLLPGQRPGFRARRRRP